MDKILNYLGFNDEINSHLNHYLYHFNHLFVGSTGMAHIHVKESTKPGHVDVLMDLKRWLQGMK